MATEAQNILKQYQELQKKYADERKAAEKSTSYLTSGRVAPTTSDLKREETLRKLETQAEDLMSQYQKIRWYGSEEEQAKQKELYQQMTPEERSREGVFSRGLHMLSTPLYGVVGAAETALGKGSKEGLFSNIAANVKERETFGDLIRKYGASNWVATPLGLALDIALDPVNWLTLGTGALVPRVAYGAYKGARVGEGLVAGARAGLESGLARKAATAAKYTPFIRKGNLAEELAQTAGRKMDWYDSVVGADDITKQLPWTNAANKAKQGFSDFIDRQKWGDQFKKAFAYKATEPVKESAKLEDILRDIPQVRTGEEAADLIRSQEKRGFLDEILEHDYVDPNKLVSGEAAKATNILNDAEGKFVSSSAAENAARLAEEAARDREMARIYAKIQDIADEKTGINFIDENKEKIGKWFEQNRPELQSKLEKVSDAYKTFIAHFKIAKVPLSPAAYTNALLGNAVMTKMAGIDLSPELASSIKNAMKMVNGKKVDVNFIKKFVGNEEIANWIEKYPKTFTMAFGVNPDALRDRRLILSKLEEIMKSDGKNKANMKQILSDAYDEVGNLFRPYEAGKAAARGAGISGNVPSSFYTTTYSADVLAGMADIQQRLVRRLEDVEGPYAKQFAEWYKKFLTKPMNWYESIDQSYKLGIFAHLADNGISRKEFDLLKKILPITKDDVTKVKGYDLYKLTPSKAVEASQEIYMNYRAMPGVVKALRSTPILGAPFASFMYAMATKTAKTAAYNPAFFTKMNSLMSEVSGGQDPAERKMLDSVYNSYLNQPGMMKLPMFTKNPVYMRVEQMLPYYSLNIFQPGARDLNSPIARTITDVTDKVGVFSDPLGQVLFNYFVLPMTLQDEAPKGLFGNQLYPSDATALQKYLAYPLRDVVEATVPPAVGIAGTAAGWAGQQPARLPGESLLKDIPVPGIGTEEYFPSFRWRQFARAARGQTSVGVGATEDPVSRWARVFASWFGLPMYRSTIYTSDISEE